MEMNSWGQSHFYWASFLRERIIDKELFIATQSAECADWILHLQRYIEFSPNITEYASHIFFGGMGYILSKALDKGFFSFFGRTSVPDANLFCLLLVETQAIGISQVLRYRLSYDFHSQLRWRRHNTHTIWLFSPISGQCISRQKTYIVRFFCLSDIELPTGCLPSLIQGGNWSARFTVTIERLSRF